MDDKPIMAVSADWHLSPLTWLSHPEVRGDSLVTASWLVDYCISAGLDLAVAGDITDVKQPPSEVVHCLRCLIEEMSKNSLDYFYVRGQHDLTDPPIPAAVCDDATYLPEVIVVKHRSGICLVGLDYTPPEHLAEAIGKLPGKDSTPWWQDDDSVVLLCHQTWKETLQLVTPIGQFDGSLSDVASKGFKMIVAGDIHIHKTLTLPGGTTVLSPGSITSQDFRESPDKFFYVLYGGKGGLRAESVRIPTRPIRSLSISSDAEMDAFLKSLPTLLSCPDDVPPELQRPILRIECSLALDHGSSKIREAVGKEAVLVIKPISPKKTEMVCDADALSDKAEEGMQACADTFAPNFGQQAVSDALRLLRPGVPPKDELAAMRREHGLEE